tara:strand:- start:10214 stop:12358 length:2145 start_codon:yes stop_codon:yes gene_type:complete
MKNKNLITNEVPIKRKEEDLLNYYPFANKIQKIIQGYSNNPEPLTIGIYGKWGTGKTSLLNLIEKHIEIFQKDKEDKPFIKFHYSPWLYQNKEEMLFDFFETLIRKLNYSGDNNLKKAGRFIKKYSRYLKAIKLSTSVGIPKIFNAGISIEPYEILKRLGEDIQGGEKGLNDFKKDINDELLKSDKKIIIYIDDIDRLDKDEIFTLFKLIKINADFKNLIFIACLDPEHVAKAIHHRYGNEEKSGMDFLEKIINIPLELPLVEAVDLDYFLKQKIKSILSSKSINKVDLDELYSSLKGHYFSSPREIIRVTNSFSVSLYAIGDEVNIHDLFWIEFIKVKHIKAYQKIKEFAKKFKSRIALYPIITFNDSPTKEKKENGLRKIFAEEHKEAYIIIDFLFRMDRGFNFSNYKRPAIKSANVLNAELRINHVNHFEKYFSFHIKGKLSEFQFSKFKQEITDENYGEALSTMKKILQSTQERKVVYRIKSEIETAQNEFEYRLITFLIDNAQLFSEISDVNPNSIEIIRDIADKLKQNSEENKELTLSIVEKLDYEQLSWFLGTFRYNSLTLYENEINEALIDKVRKSDKQPFFTNRNISKMIMEIWSKIEFEEFENYILNYLDSEQNIKYFFKCFPYFWNGKINGVFKSEDFDYLTKEIKLDNKLIYQRIKKVIPEIGNLKYDDFKELSNSWDDKVDNSGFQNIQQFVFYHFKKEQI